MKQNVQHTMRDRQINEEKNQKKDVIIENNMEAWDHVIGCELRRRDYQPCKWNGIKKKKNAMESVSFVR